jgi:hypothetical protein
MSRVRAPIDRHGTMCIVVVRIRRYSRPLYGVRGTVFFTQDSARRRSAKPGQAIVVVDAAICLLGIPLAGLSPANRRQDQFRGPLVSQTDQRVTDTVCGWRRHWTRSCFRTASQTQVNPRWPTKSSLWSAHCRTAILTHVHDSTQTHRASVQPAQAPPPQHIRARPWPHRVISCNCLKSRR